LNTRLLSLNSAASEEVSAYEQKAGPQRCRWLKRSGETLASGSWALPLSFFATTVLVVIQGYGFNNQLHPSATDAWDISSGAIVAASTELGSGSDAKKTPSGSASSAEPGSVLFEDGKPSGYIHTLEWQTVSPIELKSIRLFAKGDGIENNNAREFGSFVLKTKSSPASGFDIQILSYAPSHPYDLADPVTFALLSVNVSPTVGQFFRAEFMQFGTSAPRIINSMGLWIH
jgi:hypothetical protein